MRKIDDILWHMLAVTGLNFVNYKLGPMGKFSRALFMVGFVTSVVYFIIVYMRYIEKQLYKEGITSSLICIYSGLMWCIGYYKRKSISYVVLKVYQLLKFYNTTKKAMDYIIIIIVVVVLVIPFLMCIINIEHNFENFDVEFLTFGFEIQNKIWKNVFIFSVTFADFGLSTGFPLYLTICISVLFYRSSEVLCGYGTFLRNNLCIIAKETAANYADFFQMVNLLRKLNNAFTQLAFFIILFNLQAILTTILAAFETGILELTFIRLVLFAYYCVCSVVVLVYFTICSSMIPENLVTITRIVKNFVNIYRYSHFISEKNLFFLMRIENEDIIHISVCGMFHVTRNYILTALGLMLTYGLLIINLKF